jgi:hypothetical protein
MVAAVSASVVLGTNDWNHGTLGICCYQARDDVAVLMVLKSGYESESGKSWRCIFTSKCWSLTTTRSKVETEFATVRFTAVCNVARENTSTTT